MLCFMLCHFWAFLQIFHKKIIKENNKLDDQKEYSSYDHNDPWWPITMSRLSLFGQLSPKNPNYLFFLIKMIKKKQSTRQLTYLFVCSLPIALLPTGQQYAVHRIQQNNLFLTIKPLNSLEKNLNPFFKSLASLNSYPELNSMSFLSTLFFWEKLFFPFFLQRAEPLHCTSSSSSCLLYCQ